MTHTIVLVDDHPVFRQGLNHLLSKEKDLEVVGEAGDGQMAIELVRKESPVLVVMDINMPNLDGIEATRQILSESPDTKIVALSVHSGKQFVRDMIQAGASGYILKESIPEEMVVGIRTVLAGDVYLSKSISNILISDYKTLISESDPEPVDPTLPLLYTKLHRPPISAEIIPRARLVELLEIGAQYPMTLIAAPAGYGKSILASQWLEVSESPSGWVSLDENDNDLWVFLSYVVEAIQTVFPGRELRTRSLLGSTNLPSLKVTARYLLNDLETIPKRFILAIDDYHHIRKAAVHDLLMELLVHPSPLMHLVLITRRDPPLPLTSLRSWGMFTEISAKDLRFSTMETKSYLERFLRIAISDRTAQVLEDKMEGWVTGLHLAALSIKSEADQERITAGLLESSQYVRNYLIEEVLSQVPLPFEGYLAATTILNRFCASLCDAVVHEGGGDHRHVEAGVNGRAFIEWLNRSHLFAIPLDTGNKWFRFHHMFRDLLQGQLRQRFSADEIAELHFRASEWYESHNLIDEAIHHALTAGDPVRAAEIVEQHRYSEMYQDKWYILKRWLGFLPQKIIQQRPALLLTQAWQRFNQFRLLEIPPLLEQAGVLLADESADESLRGELDFHRGYLSLWLYGDGKAALKHLENARSRLPEAYRELVAETEFDIAIAHHMIGEGKSIIESLNERIRTTISPDVMLKTRLVGAPVFIYLLSGDLKSALPAAQKMKSVAKEGRNIHIVGWADYLQALAQLQSYQLDQALQNFLSAAEQRDILFKKAAVEVLVGLVLTYQAMQRADDAWDAMKQLMEFARMTEDVQYIAVAESCRARLALSMGDIESAYRWAQSFDGKPHAPSAVFFLEEPSITQYRIRIAVGPHEDLEGALESLGSLRQQAAAIHFTCQTIEIAVLQCVALEKLGRADEAIETLAETLSLAGPFGWVRPFVEAGPIMADLLKHLLKKGVAVPYIETILAAFSDAGPIIPLQASSPDSKAAFSPELPVSPSSRPQPLVEPLTNRELDVLELLAQRLQNKEIADKLFITTETVKGHLKNIYQKLSVKNRRAAVEEAKRLKII